jgi:hypothetical protein
VTSRSAVPTLPGPTEEQLDEALRVVARVYAEAGVGVRLEWRRTIDPEFPDWEVVQIQGWIDEPVAMQCLVSLSGDVPDALAKAGLYEPSLPIVAVTIPAW